MNFQFLSLLLLAFMGDLTRFGNVKQYIAFIGLNPREYCSGSSSLRRAFYMPALVAMRHNPVIQKFALRLKQSGKNGKLIACAVMRKLVHIIYGILKSGLPFQFNLTS